MILDWYKGLCIWAFLCQFEEWVKKIRTHENPVNVKETAERCGPINLLLSHFKFMSQN